MIKKSVCLFLTFLPVLAMQPDGDEMLVKICALRDEHEHAIAKLPMQIALQCETIRRSIDFRIRSSELSRDFDTYPFYVAPQFSSPALWEKLKPCIEWVDNVKRLLHSPRDLGGVLVAANYLENESLYNACLAEWVERNYAFDPSLAFPQEVEGAIAYAMVSKHEIGNKLIMCAVENIGTPMQHFISKGSGDVWSCALGLKGSSIAAGRSDGDIHCWLKKKHGWKRCVINRAHGGSEVGRVQFIDGDTKLISSARSKGVRIWDLATGSCLKSFGDQECDGFYFAYDEAQGLLAISTKDSGVNVYTLKRRVDQTMPDGYEDPVLRLQLDGHADLVYAIDFSPREDLLVSVGNDRVLSLWNLENGEGVYDFDLPGNPLSVCFNHQGNQVAVGMRQGWVQIYDIEKFCRVAERDDAHSRGVWSCAYSPDDSLLVTAADDRKIKVWALPGLECLRVIEGNLGEILFMDTSFARNQFLVGFSNGNLALVNSAPLLAGIAAQRSLIKYGMKIDRARFMVAAGLATREAPLILSVEQAKVFKALSKKAQDQLIKHFEIVPPAGWQNTPSKPRAHKKKKKRAPWVRK